jgi:hypothetical protein
MKKSLDLVELKGALFPDNPAKAVRGRKAQLVTRPV